MRNLIVSVFALALFTVGALAQNNSSTTAAKQTNTNANVARKKRPPIFRASKDQIKQAQTVLKGRNFYSGELTGKLDSETRDGLKKYQQAEGMKVTGTLNAATIEKMQIQMSDKQKETWKQIQASQANANTN
jgi:peptidoglycan hydrolase-like protein with peptidoglycan-binding domain